MKTVQARLDENESRLLAQLVRRLGWSPSQAVREGLRLLAATHPSARSRKIAGLGKFASGVPDLGSSKRHLRGFGR